MSKLFAALCVSIVSNFACAQPGDIRPGEIIVRPRPDETIADIVDSYNADIIGSYPSRNLYLLRINPDDDAQQEDLLGDDRLELADRNRDNAITGGHTQSFFVGVYPSQFWEQPLWRVIGLPSALPDSDGRTVCVAVLDTGVVPHVLFARQVRLDGANFVDGLDPTQDAPQGVDSNGNGIPDELVGHGTFVAGLISHLAPGCTLLPVRVLDSDGVGSTFSVTAGVYFALDSGVGIINISLSQSVDSPVLNEAIAAANAANVLVVCAAGNQGSDQLLYPAASPGVVSVCATDNAGVLTPWSSYGHLVRFAAPGLNVVSTLADGSFASASGTSASAAIISGALARSLTGAAPAVAQQKLNALWNLARNIDYQNPLFAGMVGRFVALPPKTKGPAQVKPVP